MNVINSIIEKQDIILKEIKEILSINKTNFINNKSNTTKKYSNNDNSNISYFSDDFNNNNIIDNKYDFSRITNNKDSLNEIKLLNKKLNIQKSFYITKITELKNNYEKYINSLTNNLNSKDNMLLETEYLTNKIIKLKLKIKELKDINNNYKFENNKHKLKIIININNITYNKITYLLIYYKFKWKILIM